MKSEQYEELCRKFLSEKFGLPVERIQSKRIPNPQRTGLPEYNHQIDLRWETGHELSVYLHIANAKWRGTEKVEQGEVLLLQQVKQKVGAHKAMMITNTGFTAGAKAAAQDDGIALHIVVPSPDLSDLPVGDREAIRRALEARANASDSPLYSHTVEHRAIDAAPPARPIAASSQEVRPAAAPASYETRIATGYTTRVVGEGSSSGGGRGCAGIEHRGGGPFTRGGRS